MAGEARGQARGQNTRLSDVVAVELGEGLAAAYCGRWLRLHGATVIKIEDATSGGDRLRREDLTPDGWRRSERRSMFAALHAGKESVSLDYGSDEGQSELHDQLFRADVVISSFTRDELLERGLSEALFDLPGERVAVSCTPFGLDGPYADYQATDEVLLAYGGSMSTLGQSKGPPRHVRVPMADFVGGVFGFQSALLGLLNPAAGRYFDVSVADCLAANLERVTMFYSHLGLIHLRGHGMHRHFAGHPGGLYPCKDGYVMVAMAGSPIQMMALLVEQPELEDHPALPGPPRAAPPPRRVRRADPALVHGARGRGDREQGPRAAHAVRLRVAALGAADGRTARAPPEPRRGGRARPRRAGAHAWPALPLPRVRRRGRRPRSAGDALNDERHR